MLLSLPSGVEFFLDGLVLETILCSLRAVDLRSVSSTCRALCMPAQAAAHRSLQTLLQRLQCTTLRELERGSWITQLLEWEIVVGDNVAWLQADASSMVLIEKVLRACAAPCAPLPRPAPCRGEHRAARRCGS